MQGAVSSVEWTAAINVLAPLAFALFGWILKALWTAVTDLQKADKDLTRKVNSIEVMVAGDYIKRDEMSHMFNQLMLRLDKIEDKLDGKADK